MKYAKFSDDFLSYFRLDDNGETLVLTDKRGFTRAVKLLPYEDRPQSEFTDLELKVIADSINYLLGAELLEENGYTEEVVGALKSVLQKIGAEENHT